MTTANVTQESTPVIGEGANVFGYSDVRAFTVVSISPNGLRCKIRRDRATLLNGLNSGAEDALQFEAGGFCGHTSGQQRYAYEADADGEVLTVSLRKNGQWRTSGGKGERVRFGARRERYDFNF